MYEILYEKKILKDLDKIPASDVARIVASVRELSVNPAPRGAKKLSGQLTLYRIRQGDYRVVYTVDKREKMIRIVLIRHRGKAYRRV